MKTRNLKEIFKEEEPNLVEPPSAGLAETILVWRPGPVAAPIANQSTNKKTS